VNRLPAITSRIKPFGRLATVGFYHRHHLKSFTNGLKRPLMAALVSLVQCGCPGALVETLSEWSSEADDEAYRDL